MRRVFWTQRKTFWLRMSRSFPLLRRIRFLRGDDNTANIDEILKKLSIERNRNKDLNETISDILERMAAMEKNIIRNEEKITDNQSSVVLLTKDVEDLTEEVAGVQDGVAAVQGEGVSVAEDVEKNLGRWFFECRCGFSEDL